MTARAPAPLSPRWNRRQLLAAALSMPLLAGATTRAGLAADAGNARFLAARLHDARAEAVLLDASGRDVAVLALPDRGHSFAIDPARGRAVAFGRQPGFFALVMDLADGKALGRLPLPDDRHFFGHGAFSVDGTRLFATENDFDAGRGVIGVYDARPGAGWQRLGEFDSGGIGPHELVLLPDGATLCVANGGLLTHPDYGKTTLNLSTMQPSLAYLDARDGRLLEQVVLPPELFQLSIRHLAIDAAGDVWFACQHQGSAAEDPPLLGRHCRGAAPQLLRAPSAVQRALRNYIGSIAADGQGLIAASSPVGGQVAWWDARDGECLGMTARADGCGVAPLGDGRFVVSDGFGGLLQAGPAVAATGLAAPRRGLSWDNHLRRL